MTELCRATYECFTINKKALRNCLVNNKIIKLNGMDKKLLKIILENKLHELFKIEVTIVDQKNIDALREFVDQDIDFVEFKSILIPESMYKESKSSLLKLMEVLQNNNTNRIRIDSFLITYDETICISKRDQLESFSKLEYQDIKMNKAEEIKLSTLCNTHEIQDKNLPSEHVLKTQIHSINLSLNNCFTHHIF
jgi:hypothetical protein